MTEEFHDILIDVTFEGHDEFGEALYALPAPGIELGMHLAAGRFDVELYPAAVKHASQMKYGDARGARFLLTLDDDGTMSVKDMESGDRASATPADVPALLGKLAGPG